MAHAIHNYDGPCKNIHGHSYELHATFSDTANADDYIPGLGMIIDFKDLKKIVNNTVISVLDHRLVVSNAYLAAHPEVATASNIILWEYEPTAENILYFIRNAIRGQLSGSLQLVHLKLYETNSSYAVWEE